MEPADVPRSSHPASLPRLADPSRAQLALSGLFIVTAGLLWGTLAIDVIRHLDPWHWWVPLAPVAGAMAADFVSGLVHWSADTWGRADYPLIGPRILVPFRVHHVNPDDFLRRTFLDTNGDVAALLIPILLAAFWIPLDSEPGQAMALASLAFCGLSTMTNQIHQWAHMPTPPRAVAVLQGAGVFLHPRNHARHHGRPYDGEYCITTGWCNRPLEAFGFFRRLERIITRVSGAEPRHDEHTVGPRPTVRRGAPRRV